MLELKRACDGAEPDLDAIRDARELARESLDELRRISHELRPAVLDELGLASALEALCSAFGRRTGLQVSTVVAGALPELGRQVDLALYRVTQEALTNAARHTRCSSVEVALELSTGGRVVLRVCDDGLGMGGARPGGGIRGMRERALMAGGAFSIDPSGDGSGGTAVSIRVPVGEVRP